MREYIFDGAFVSLMRKRHGLTLEALGKKLGTSKGYIWELENKQRVNPSFSVVAALADILEVPMKAFICRSDIE